MIPDPHKYLHLTLATPKLEKSIILDNCSPNAFSVLDISDSDYRAPLLIPKTAPFTLIGFFTRATLVTEMAKTHQCINLDSSPKYYPSEVSAFTEPRFAILMKFELFLKFLSYIYNLRIMTCYKLLKTNVAMLQPIFTCF